VTLTGRGRLKAPSAAGGARWRLRRRSSDSSPRSRRAAHDLGVHRADVLGPRGGRRGANGLERHVTRVARYHGESGHGADREQDVRRDRRRRHPAHVDEEYAKSDLFHKIAAHGPASTPLTSSAPDALTPRAFGWRVGGLLALGAIATAAVFTLPPIPQDPAYHDFADHRRVLGIPSALNVLSNLPLALVGSIGLAVVARGRGGWERAALLVLFTGLALTGVGSAYYHAAPTTATLFWDRLPMAVAFMAFCALTLGERVSPRAGPWLLAALVMIGVASVVIWRLGETAGAGDLRLYGLVQFLPAVLLPLALVLFPARWLRTSDLLGAIGWYAVAKLCEALDRPIFAVGGIVSGHTLKHLAAATAAAWLLRVVAGSPEPR